MDGLKDTTHKALRASERYTRTDMVYLAKGGFWLTLTRIIGAIAGLVATLALANFLSKDDFGLYKYVLTLAGIASAFSLSGIGSAITQAAARGFHGTLRFGFKAATRYGHLTSAVALVMAGYYAYADHMILAGSLVIVALLQPVVQNSILWSPYLTAIGRFDVETRFSALNAIIPTITLVVVAWLFPSAVAVTAAWFISTAATAFFCYKRTISHYTKNDTIDEASLGYSKHLSIMAVFGTISYQLDRVFVFHYAGAAALAAYAVALAGPQQVRYLSKVMATMALPKLANRNIAELKKTLHRKAFLVFLGSAALVAGLWIFLPYVMALFFPEYPEAVFISQMFSLVILFFPSTLYQQALVAHVKTKELYVLNIGAPAVKLIALVLFVPAYGALGAIAAILAMEIARSIAVIYLFGKAKETEQESLDTETPPQEDM
jgi:O-antigen/teichoic acid export membrane protein